MPDERREAELGCARQGPVTRGRLLRRLGVLLGAGAVAGPLSSARAALPPGTRLRLMSADATGHTEGRRFGQLPQAGERAVSWGTLLDARGNRVGTFHASADHSDTPTGRIQLAHHVLLLGQGQIVAIGALAGDGGELAVVGGTGTFARASGSLTVQLAPRGLAGDGSALFDLVLDR